MKSRIKKILKYIIINEFHKKENVDKKLIIISDSYSIIEFIRKKYKNDFLKRNINFLSIKEFLDFTYKWNRLNKIETMIHFFSILKKNDIEEKKFIDLIPEILDLFKILNLKNEDHFFNSIISIEKIKNWGKDLKLKEKLIFWKKVKKYYSILLNYFMKKNIEYEGISFNNFHKLKFFDTKKIESKKNCIFFFCRRFYI